MPTPKPTLEKMTLRQLRKIASLLNIPRYSRMRKAQLLQTIKIKQNNLHSETLSYSELKKKLADSTAKDDELVSRETLEILLGLEEKQSSTIEAQPINNYKPKFGGYPPDFFVGVDDGLGELPSGYGIPKIVLMPCSPRSIYTYWDITSEQKDALREKGGRNISLRLHDVSKTKAKNQNIHSTLEYIANEIANNWYLPVALDDRDYIIEIGYRRIDGKWLSLAKSQPARIPSLSPSDWIEDIFVRVPWEKPLTGEKIHLLPYYDGEKLKTQPQFLPTVNRVDNSSFSSQQQNPASHTFISPVSSYQLTPSAKKADNFWLIANAKLTIDGATLPNAKVKIGDREIQLDANGTFSLEVSFPDGNLDFPIEAASADNQQTRSIEMTFTRQTNPPATSEEKNTNSDFKSPTDTQTDTQQINSNSTDNSDWFPSIDSQNDSQDDFADSLPLNDNQNDSQDDVADSFPLNDNQDDDEDDISDWFPPIRP